MSRFYTFIFLLLSTYSFAQLPDFPLIDSSSEWNFEGFFAYQEFAHCNQGFATEHSTITFFIDGDTTIADHSYLMLFAERVNANYCTANTSIQWADTSTYFQKYIREANHALYVYDTFSETDVLFWNYESIDIGTVLNNSCTVGSIDTLYLLHQPYLRYNCDCGTEYLIQGIGTKRNLFASLECGVGIEGDWHNLCYTKNGFTISLDSLTNCVSTGDSTLYVATNDWVLGENYTLYPNPTTDFVMLDFNDNVSGSYTLFSLTGKEVTARSFLNKHYLKIDLSTYPKGVYFLVLYTDKGSVLPMKIIKSSTLSY